MEKHQILRRHSENCSGEVITVVHKWEEIEANEVPALRLDRKGVGGGSCEDAGSLVESRGERGGPGASSGVRQDVRRSRQRRRKG